VLTTLDPGIGAGHLSPIVDEAFVVVTAGRASAAKVQATAEILRAAGLSVLGGILVGADSNDESLGLRAGTRRSRRAADGFDDLMETSFASASAAEHH
jgi:Mrp family chromosome partitioning ATPase